MNFYLIRLPGEDIASASSVRLLEDFDQKMIANADGSQEEGFIYSEFKEFPDIFLIPADNKSFSDKDVKEWALENDRLSAEKFPFIPDSSEKEQHIETIIILRSKTIEWQSKGIRSKVIASRISREKCPVTPSELFNRLCKTYPDACVFLFSTSRHGTWIGASPEIILSVGNNSIRTISLAGTRWNQNMADIENPEWDLKNIEEQQIVTDFLVYSLKKFGFSPVTDGPRTLKAGPVEHIATFITSEGKPTDFSLLRHLCPTPALSGFPRREAIEAIIEAEKYPRECYGGMIGLLRPSGEYITYANLRSGRFDTTNQAIELHAGGGITPLSDPEVEWEETENKLSTLRKVICDK